MLLAVFSFGLSLVRVCQYTSVTGDGYWCLRQTAGEFGSCFFAPAFVWIFFFFFSKPLRRSAKPCQKLVPVIKRLLCKHSGSTVPEALRGLLWQKDYRQQNNNSTPILGTCLAQNMDSKSRLIS